MEQTQQCGDSLNTKTRFSETHIEESIPHVEGEHENGLFFKCRVSNLRGATLRDCVLDGSKLDIKRIEDALDLTVTLNCASFNNVELSPLMFDLLLVLLMKTAGNEERRKKLIGVIGRDRLIDLLRKLEKLQ